jgi:hypothetical protein
MIETAVAATVAASAPVVATATAAEIGFFAVVAGFVGGWALVILAVLAVFGILAEHNKSSGWAVFWLLLAGGVAAIAFHVPLMVLGITAVAYIAIGLVWSFWRYKRHVTEQVALHRLSDSRIKEDVLRKIHPKNMLGTITAWIIVWPFSFVASFVGDLINFIQSLVTKFFRGVYFKIYDSAVAALKS